VTRLATRATAVVIVLGVGLGAHPARAQDADPWFGRDKALHFSATASIAVVGYAGTALVTEDRRARAGVAAGLAIGAGIGKELWDLGGHGDPSTRDLVWDAVGTATGVLVAWTVDWLFRHVTASTSS
jgi:putative lipoprotein